MKSQHAKSPSALGRSGGWAFFLAANGGKLSLSMGPFERSEHPPTGRVLSPEDIDALKGALQTLLALLQEYAPPWYAESHRKQAEAAIAILSDE